MSDAVLIPLVLYVLIGLGWFTVCALGATEGDSRRERRTMARHALLAPVWPITLLVLMARGLVWLVRVAVEEGESRG